MKSFRLTSILACAAIACMAAFASATSTLVRAAVATFLVFKDVVLDGFKLAGGRPEVKNRPMVAFVQAKAFVLRLAQRKRPEVFGGWRMCPST